MKKTVVVVLMVAALAVLTTGIVFAQNPQPPAPRGGGMGPGGFGQMRLAANGAEAPMHEYMVSAIADALGISATDLEGRIDSGETAYQVAVDLGFTADEIPALLRDARLKAFDAAAADGVISQAQVDWMRSRPFGMGTGNCDGTGQHMGGGRFQQTNP